MDWIKIVEKYRNEVGELPELLSANAFRSDRGEIYYNIKDDKDFYKSCWVRENIGEGENAKNNERPDGV